MSAPIVNAPATDAGQPSPPHTPQPGQAPAASLALVLSTPAPAAPPPIFRLSPGLRTFLGPVIFCNPSISKTGIITHQVHGRKKKPLKSRTNSPEGPHPAGTTLWERAQELVKGVRVGYQRSDGRMCSVPMPYGAGFWLQECELVEDMVLVGYLETLRDDSDARMFYRVKDGLSWIPTSCPVPLPLD